MERRRRSPKAVTPYLPQLGPQARLAQRVIRAAVRGLRGEIQALGLRSFRSLPDAVDAVLRCPEAITCFPSADRPIPPVVEVVGLLDELHRRFPDLNFPKAMMEVLLAMALRPIETDLGRSCDGVASALTECGAALLRAGHFGLAEIALRTALLNARFGSRDEALRSRALLLVCRVRTARKDYAGADRLGRWLARVHAHAGQRIRLGRTCVTLGNNFLAWGYPKQAFVCHGRALTHLTPTGDLLGYMTAGINFCFLALRLNLAGDAASIVNHLCTLRSEDLPAKVAIRLDWLLASIQRTQGNLVEAERALASVAARYLELGMQLPFCRAALERAAVLTQLGRVREIGVILGPVLTLLRRHEHPQELHTAVTLLNRALLKGKVAPDAFRRIVELLDAPPPRKR